MRLNLGMSVVRDVRLVSRARACSLAVSLGYYVRDSRETTERYMRDYCILVLLTFSNYSLPYSLIE